MRSSNRIKRLGSPNQKEVVDLCRAILIVYRDHGLRANRQKSRLMWLIDEWKIIQFRAHVEKELGYTLETAAEKDEIDWEKRDHIGLYPQKQPGMHYIGLNIPVGKTLCRGYVRASPYCRSLW